MTHLEIILAVVTPLMIITSIIFLTELWKACKARKEEDVHQDPAPTPSPKPTQAAPTLKTADGFTEEEAIKKLAKDYPCGFKTSCYGQTVYIKTCWVDGVNSLFINILVVWWDDLKHLKEEEVNCASFQVLSQVLEPKKHYVAVDPKPIDDDDEGSPV